MRTLNNRCFHENFRKWTKGFGCNPSCVVEMVWWDGWWLSNHFGRFQKIRGGSTPPPPLKPLICVSSQPTIQNHPPSLDQPYWPSAEDGYRASMQNMGHWFWILVCAVNFFKFVLPVLRIRDVYPGSDFFHPGSRIQGWQDSGFRIPDQHPHQRSQGSQK